MTSELKWQKSMMDKFDLQYPNMDPQQRTQLKQLLHQHWNLCAAKGGHAFKRIIGLMSGGIAAVTNLSGVLPAAAVPIVLGRASFMALSYLAGNLLTQNILPVIIPVLSKLEQQHLNGLFKKADDAADLIRELGKINQEISDALVKDQQATIISTAGFFVGTVLTGAMHGERVVRFAEWSPVSLATVSSFIAPKIAYGMKHGIAGIRTNWEDDLMASADGQAAPKMKAN